jgi:hypothetical protein
MTEKKNMSTYCEQGNKRTYTYGLQGGKHQHETPLSVASLDTKK